MSVRVAPEQKERITLTVNGKVRYGFAEPRMLLTDFLRHELQVFGVRRVPQEPQTFLTESLETVG